VTKKNRLRQEKLWKVMEVISSVPTNK